MQSEYERTDLIITEFDVEDIISTSGENEIGSEGQGSCIIDYS